MNNPARGALPLAKGFARPALSSYTTTGDTTKIPC
jgi:hypothetical protein